MPTDKDSQVPEELSRQAEELLAEYFRIRREYNELDKDNPAHTERRAALKERYHELDRRYTQLVKTQDDLVEQAQGPTQSRADILWQGALESEARANEPIDHLSPDAPWIELTTPQEGAATNRIFEEALRRSEAKKPPIPAELDELTDHSGEAEADDDPTPVPEIDAFEDSDADFETESPANDPPPSPPPYTVDALRELTERLRSSDLDETDRGLAGSFDPTHTEHEVGGIEAEPENDMEDGPEEEPEPYVEIDYTPPLQSTPPPRRAAPPRAVQRPRVPVEKPKPPVETVVACPSCGERLPAGTKACRFCGARLIAPDADEAEIVLPHLQLQTAEPRRRANFGLRALIALGWLLVVLGAGWTVIINFDVLPDQINPWLDHYGLDILRKDQSGEILGVAVVLLGGTLIGVGIFASRFIRVVVSMHELARNGRVDSIEKLILRGEELDARDERGCTALHFAVVAKQREAVAVLVGNGADVNSHNKRGDTPLHMAVANRDHALVQYLIKKGADVETTNEGGTTLMHVAAQVGDVGLSKLFLEKGLSVDQATKVGFTPLHFAAQSGHDDAMEFLLANGADANAASDHGTTPIFPATRNGHLNAVRLLVAAGADYNARRGHDFESPLGIARIHKRREVFEYLESIGAEE